MPGRSLHAICPAGGMHAPQGEQEVHPSNLYYCSRHVHLCYRDLAAKSEGLLSRVDTAVELQRQANDVLTHMLGARYTLGGVWDQIPRTRLQPFIQCKEE